MLWLVIGVIFFVMLFTGMMLFVDKKDQLISCFLLTAALYVWILSDRVKYHYVIEVVSLLEDEMLFNLSQKGE